LVFGLAKLAPRLDPDWGRRISPTDACGPVESARGIKAALKLVATGWLFLKPTAGRKKNLRFFASLPQATMNR